MAELFYKEDRDNDFMSVCNSVLKAGKGTLSTPAMVMKAVRCPAKSFFLHPREYSNIIHKKGQNLPKSVIKREMHLEILRRYEQLQSENPEQHVHEIAKMIAEQPAPRFYISDRRAIDLYYELMKNKRNKSEKR